MLLKFSARFLILPNIDPSHRFQLVNRCRGIKIESALIKYFWLGKFPPAVQFVVEEC